MKQKKVTTLKKRILSAPLLSFALKEHIRQLKKQSQWKKGDRNAITLVKTSKVRVVLMPLRNGVTMREHHVEGPLTLFVLTGAIRFVLGTVKCKLPANTFMTLESTIPHDVVALTDSVLLLTIVQP